MPDACDVHVSMWMLATHVLRIALKQSRRTRRPPEPGWRRGMNRLLVAWRYGDGDLHPCGLQDRHERFDGMSRAARLSELTLD